MPFCSLGARIILYSSCDSVSSSSSSSNNSIYKEETYKYVSIITGKRLINVRKQNAAFVRVASVPTDYTGSTNTFCRETRLKKLR
jgi:hypothetical protein